VDVQREIRGPQLSTIALCDAESGRSTTSRQSGSRRTQTKRAGIVSAVSGTRRSSIIGAPSHSRTRSGGIDWGADLDLAELLVEGNGRLDEAQTMLDRAAAKGLAFKSERWRWLVTDARLAATVGQRDRSMASAGAALKLLDDDSPDFPRHPDIGHIDTDGPTIRKVKRLAASM
jgi:hypothetical protein